MSTSSAKSYNVRTLSDHSSQLLLWIFFIFTILSFSTELRAFSPIALSHLSAPNEDGVVKTSKGNFIVKGRGEYYYNDGKNNLRIDEKDVPPEVKAYAEKNFPANGEIISDGRRYKINSDGFLIVYIDKLNTWGLILDKEISSLPDDVQKYYYENRGTYDKILMNKIFRSPMWGGVTPTEAQIAEQEKIILKIASSNGKIKSDVYDWTKDPVQLRADAIARAQTQNRDYVTKLAGGIIFNNSAQRIVHDYLSNYTKKYRVQQIEGSHPSAPLPEWLSIKLERQMNPATADPDGAKETMIQMREALADEYGSGYNALLPDYGGASTYNNGQTDYFPSRIPMGDGEK